MLAPRSVGRPGPRIAVLVVVERLKVTREADASVLTAQDGARVADVCTVDNRAPGSIVVIWLLMSSSTSSDGGNTPACITLSELPAMFSFSR